MRVEGQLLKVRVKGKIVVGPTGGVRGATACTNTTEPPRRSLQFEGLGLGLGLELGLGLRAKRVGVIRLGLR